MKLNWQLRSCGINYSALIRPISAFLFNCQSLVPKHIKSTGSIKIGAVVCRISHHIEHIELKMFNFSLWWQINALCKDWYICWKFSVNQNLIMAFQILPFCTLTLFLQHHLQAIQLKCLSCQNTVTKRIIHPPELIHLHLIGGKMHLSKFHLNQKSGITFNRHTDAGGLHSIKRLDSPCCCSSRICRMAALIIFLSSYSLAARSFKQRHTKSQCTHKHAVSP